MGWKHRKLAGILATQYSLNTGQRATLDVIADHIIEDAGNSTNLSNQNLAHKVGCSLATIIRHLKVLQQVNELTQAKVSGATSHYVFKLPEGFTPQEFNTYQADVANKMTKKQRLSAYAEMAKTAVEDYEDPSEEGMYTGTVPGIEDWRTCRQIIVELLNNEFFGANAAERIKRGIIMGEHPNWSDTPPGVGHPLPYDQDERESPEPVNRFAFDPGYNPQSGGQK